MDAAGIQLQCCWGGDRCWYPGSLSSMMTATSPEETGVWCGWTTRRPLIWSCGRGWKTCWGCKQRCYSVDTSYDLEKTGPTVQNCFPRLQCSLAWGVGGEASGLFRERSENLNSAAKLELFGLFGVSCLQICIWHLGFFGSMFLFTSKLT